MAVAVGATPYAVLDEQFRVVEVGPAAPAGLRPLCGQHLLDCFPGSRPLFLPYLEEAQRTGRIVKFAQYFDGYVAHLEVVPTGSTLTLSWERLEILDFLTIDGLRASLRSVLDTLRAREDALHREVVRRSLRVVESEP